MQKWTCFDMLWTPYAIPHLHRFMTLPSVTQGAIHKLRMLQKLMFSYFLDQNSKFLWQILDKLGLQFPKIDITNNKFDIITESHEITGLRKKECFWRIDSFLMSHMDALKGDKWLLCMYYVNSRFKTEIRIMTNIDVSWSDFSTVYILGW